MMSFDIVFTTPKIPVWALAVYQLWSIRLCYASPSKYIATFRRLKCKHFPLVPHRKHVTSPIQTPTG